MPLAIELAAARVGSMTVVEIASRLDQRFRVLRGRHGMVEARHETLQAALDWSFELCTGPEKALLTGLSVFSGSFDLAAAHVVCGGEGDELATLELLDALVDRSLLTPVQRGDRTRFMLLETIRQYGAGRLTNAERHRLGRRHMEHYASLWRDHRGELLFSDLGTTDERDNLRSAIQHAIAADDARSALALAASMTWLVMHHCWVEGELWALAALALSDAETYADAIWTHVMLAYAGNNMADAPATVRHARAALRIEAALGLPPHPQARRVLTVGATWLADFETAWSAGEEYLALARANGGATDVVMALFLLIHIDVFADRDADPGHVSECVRLAKESMLPAPLAAAYQAAGCALTRTDPTEAIVMYERCEAIALAAGIKAIYAGIMPAHIALLRESGPLAALRGLDVSLGRFKDLGIAFGPRRLVRDFARTFAALCRFETVAVIAGASGPAGQEPRAYAQALALAREQLGAHRYDRSFNRGRAMTNDQFQNFIDAELADLFSGEPRTPAKDR